MHNQLKNRAKKSSVTKRTLSFVLMLSMIISTMIPALGFGAAAASTGADAVLMSLTREIATAAESGNLFSADSGVFADVSNLTAWSNNTQKAVGGTGRTPIVFNNAQTTGGWKPVSVAGLGNADAFQIKFSTLDYENIRFTCSQKSTGSGPDAFLLAYSIGNLEGPYTEIPYSATGTNGIPAISRMSNDTYSALRPSYDNFVLPAEMENEAEVYLRVVFNGLTNLGANGNTSINDIVIIGDGKGGGGSVVVNKDALDALIAEASQRAESDYIAATWAVFANAYLDALMVAYDNNATQQEVNAARIRLQSAMNALKLLSEYIETIDWPGSGTVTAWDTTARFLQDSSGLDFHNGKLYAVNNKLGRFWVLDVALDGTLSFVPGFQNGKTVTFKSNNSEPDTEGITVDGQGCVYFASERDNNRSSVNWNVILQVENPFTAATTFRADRQWDITASLPNVSANLGIEAIEWISNANVAGKLFDENTNAPFDPANYPGAAADGVFFVALEDNGHVYAFVLYDNETFVRIADIDPKLGAAMALDYDEYEGVLWVKADDTKGNLTAKLTFNGTPTVSIVHVNPPSGLNQGGNYEGFAIAEARYTVNGKRPVYHFEDGLSTRSLMIGSIDCDYAADSDTTFNAETLTLQPGTDATAMNFNWYSDRSDANNASRLKIAKKSAMNGNTFPMDAMIVEGTVGDATPGKSWHKVSVIGLAQETEYVYCVSNDKNIYSEIYKFKTGSSGAFLFTVVGDPQLTTGNQDSTSSYKPNGEVGTTKQGWQNTMNAIAGKGVDFIAGVGDQVDVSLTTNEAEYANFFAPVQMQSIPFAPAVGNHDRHDGFAYHYNLPNEQSFAPLTGPDYGNPSAQQAEAEARGNYFYSYNNAIFVVLNTSSYPTGTAAAAAVIARFDATLAAAVAAHPDYDWLFVQHHKSTASVADHLADRDIQYYVEAGFEKLMDKYGVDFVLAGHDHVYARSYPMLNGVPDKTGASGQPNVTLIMGGDGANSAVNPNGTVYFTTTTGSGLKYYELFNNAGNLYVKDNIFYPYLVNDLVGSVEYMKGNLPLSAAKYLQNKTPGFIVVTVDGNTVSFAYHDLSDEYLNTPYDTYTVTKTEVRPPVEYTVTFVNWDGTVLKEETVEEGHAATAPANPIREGHTFTGWDGDFANITGDLTVTAQFRQNPAVTLVNATTSAKDFISIVETSKNSRVLVLSFKVTETYSDGTTKVVTHSINLNGNNTNLDGKYTFTDGSLKGYILVYDIKGNGSNIKEFKLNK